MMVDISGWRLGIEEVEHVQEDYLAKMPLLSIEDVQSIYVSAKPDYKKNGVGTSYFDQLIALVKTKI
jgi:hypothetical protein